MTKRDSTKILWIVEVRKARGLKWMRKGRFKTREAARELCSELRGAFWWGGHLVYHNGAYGFGNTRVTRVEKP